jgi:hypothetical protein
VLRRAVHVVVDLPAVRPGKLAAHLAAEDLTEHVRELRDPLRGARGESRPDGIRLVLRLDVRALAHLADLVREAADAFPFWSFRLLADPPECWLEVTGPGRAGELARAVFQELVR